MCFNDVCRRLATLSSTSRDVDEQFESELWAHASAGALNFVGSHALFGRNWGCAYGLRIKHLHFELCYYQVTRTTRSHIESLFACSLHAGCHVGCVDVGHRPAVRDIKDDAGRQANAAHLERGLLHP
jgi:predicted N-acyltransferase